MNIYYQWEPGSYSHLASMEIATNLSVELESIIWLIDFDGVWEKISLWNVGVLPIENSYAGSIHHNVYNFLDRDNKIIGEYNFEVHHCLLSLEDDISNISEVYSHPQALSQTYKYSKERSFTQKPFGDTAWAAKMIYEKQKSGAWAIASRLAGELYKLNILDENIQDQSGNTTKFLIVVPKSDNLTEFSIQKWRTTLLLKTNHSAGSLHTCLWVFAKRSVNMTKIESIPLGQGHFSYAFWITIEWTLWDINIMESIKELKHITDFVKILWEY
jgi:prephenate dehydratase